MTGLSERTGRSLRPIAALVVAAALLAGCGVSTGDDTFSVILPEEDPFDLDETTTTTTTTLPPPTTPPTTPDTVLPTTTDLRLETAEFYFVTTRGRLQPVSLELPPPFSSDQIADILEAGPPSGAALETLIEQGLIVSSNESRAVLTVDLDAETFARIPSTQQTEAIGQIVMTMTSSLRRVGLVTFTIDGEAISVKKGNSLLSEVGEPLAYEDYEILLTVTPPAAASTTQPPETTPETTPAPSDTTPVPVGSTVAP